MVKASVHSVGRVPSHGVPGRHCASRPQLSAHSALMGGQFHPRIRRSAFDVRCSMFQFPHKFPIFASSPTGNCPQHSRLMGGQFPKKNAAGAFKNPNVSYVFRGGNQRKIELSFFASKNSTKFTKNPEKFTKNTMFARESLEHYEPRGGGTRRSLQVALPPAQHWDSGSDVVAPLLYPCSTQCSTHKLLAFNDVARVAPYTTSYHRYQLVGAGHRAVITEPRP